MDSLDRWLLQDLRPTLEAARLGESRAGPILVSALLPHLLEYARSRASDLSEAQQESAVESALCDAITKLDRYEEDRGSFVSWVRGFVRFKLADIRRTEGRVSELPPEVPEHLEAQELRGASDVAIILQQSMERLRETDRLIVQMHTVEGFDHRTCASLLSAWLGREVSEGACRVRLHRALAALRVVLEDENHDLETMTRMGIVSTDIGEKI